MLGSNANERRIEVFTFIQQLLEASLMCLNVLINAASTTWIIENVFIIALILVFKRLILTTNRLMFTKAVHGVVDGGNSYITIIWRIYLHEAMLKHRAVMFVLRRQ